MFKYFVRRLRYGMAGKFMRTTQGFISFIVLGILILVLLTGGFSQKNLIISAFSLFWNMSSSLQENMEEQDTFVVTDEGIYLKGHEVGNEISLPSKDNKESEVGNNKDEITGKEENTKENISKEENTKENISKEENTKESASKEVNNEKSNSKDANEKSEEPNGNK